MEIRDQVAIVTGGASGLGAATARRLAGQGARVALLDINENLARQIADEVDGIAIPVDVASDTSVVAALAAVRSRLGVARIVVNAAGTGIGRKIASSKGPHPLESFRRVA